MVFSPLSGAGDEIEKYAPHHGGVWLDSLLPWLGSNFSDNSATGTSDVRVVPDQCSHHSLRDRAELGRPQQAARFSRQARTVDPLHAACLLPRPSRTDTHLRCEPGI